MPGLNVVINLYKLALLPTPSIDKALQSTISNIHHRPYHQLFSQSGQLTSGQSGSCAFKSEILGDVIHSNLDRLCTVQPQFRVDLKGVSCSVLDVD